MDPAAFHVGPWRVEPSLLRLTDGRETKTVAPRVMDLLVELASHRGEVISHDMLHARVWNGDAVGEDVLRRAVFELRKALGDSAQSPRYIETVPRRGYRLTHADPSPPSTPTQTQTHAEVSANAGQRRPVVPFVGLGLLFAAVAAVALVVFTARWFAYDPDVDLAAPDAAAPARSDAGWAVRPLTSLPGGERMPALSHDGKRVVYVGHDLDGGVDVWLQDLDADAPVRLTEDDALDVYPAWSPDDDRIAWARRSDAGWWLMVRALGSGSPRSVARLGAHGGVSGLAWSPIADVLAVGIADRSGPSSIVLFDLASGAQTRITRPPSTSMGDSRPAFAPGGNEIAFVRTRVEGVQSVHIVSVDGAERMVAAFDGKVPGLAWDARGIVLNRYLPDDRRAFWRLDPETGALTQLAIPASFALQLTASAGRLVFVEGDHGGDLTLLELTTGLTREIAPSTFWDSSPSIAPAGDRVAFASARSGSPEIWTAMLDGGAPIRHSRTGAAFASHPRWSPDGRRLAYDARTREGADIFVMAVDAAGAPRRLTDHAADDLVPTWSRDGTAIYFASNRSGSWQIWRRPLDGDAAVQITRDGGFFGVEDPVNGDLVYTNRYGGADGRVLWRATIDPTGSNPPRAAPWSEAPRPQGWGTWVLGPERLVVAARGEDGVMRLVAFDRSTARTEVVATLSEGIAGPSFALAGPDRVVYSKPGPPSGDLMVVDMAGNAGDRSEVDR